MRDSVYGRLRFTGYTNNLYKLLQVHFLLVHFVDIDCENHTTLRVIPYISLIVNESLRYFTNETGIIIEQTNKIILPVMFYLWFQL